MSEQPERFWELTVVTAVSDDRTRELVHYRAQRNRLQYGAFQLAARDDDLIVGGDRIVAHPG